MDGITEKIDEIRQRLEDPEFNARVTGLAVFVALYLAVGLGFAVWDEWHRLLTWVHFIFTVGSLWRILVFTLAGFIGVAYYVYRLKLSLLAQSRGKLATYLARAEESVDKARSEQAIEAVRKQADARVAAAEQAAQIANEARMRAERRAADAESIASLRQSEAPASREQAAQPAPQNEKPPGADEKFTEARRVFARLYHPENVKEKAGMSDAEKAARVEIFKEYWFELERIRKGDQKKSDPSLSSDC